MIDCNHPEISIRRQCELIGLNRSSYYYEPAETSTLNLELMRLIDEQYMETPYYGYRKMTQILQRQGYQVNHKRVARLMKLMGIQAIYPRPKTTKKHPEHQIYPYLLRDRQVRQSNEVWCVDITYIPMSNGFMYLVAVMDWFSRFVLSWELSNSMETDFCLKALDMAFTFGTPFIFNSDQGSQFTSTVFTNALLDRGVHISMDGRGRFYDNIFIERLWRSVKYEDVYLKKYETVPTLLDGLSGYFERYCFERPHMSLGYCTPAEVYYCGKVVERPFYL